MWFNGYTLYSNTVVECAVNHSHLVQVVRKEINMCEEQTVSLVDVLEEDEELEEEASAVLAGSDSDHCSYPQVSESTNT